MSRRDRVLNMGRYDDTLTGLGVLSGHGYKSWYTDGIDKYKYIHSHIHSLNYVILKSCSREL